MKEKQWKAEERRAHEQAPTNVAFNLKALHAQPTPSRTQGEALPSLWRQQRGESVLLPCPQGKGGQCQATLTPLAEVLDYRWDSGK